MGHLLRQFRNPHILRPSRWELQGARFALRHGRETARPRLVTAFIAALTLVLALPFRAAAHDIPVDVLVQTFLRPEGHRLHLLVRVPLTAMRDLKYPARGPGLLDVAQADSMLRDAATLWIADYIEMYEGGTRLGYPEVVAVRASQPDRAFESYDGALAEVKGPRLPDDVELFWSQGVLDVLFDYTIQSDRSDFAIHTAVARLGIRVVTVLRFLPPGGGVRVFEFTGDPGLVRVDPRWYQVSLRFADTGFRYILDRTDHLLFLFCLVVPFRRLRALIPVIASFALAPSITLIASAYDLSPDALWFPPFIDTVIAVSIVYMAFENILGGNLQFQRRWMVAFGFGLAYGFSYWFPVQQNLQFAGTHPLMSLLSFNVGIELAQVLVLVLLLPVLEVLFRFVVAERLGTIILSALVAHAGWHWMTERTDRLSQYRFQWPVFNAALLATAMRWLMVVVFLAGVAWLAFGVFRRPAVPSRKPEPTIDAEE